MGRRLRPRSVRARTTLVTIVVVAIVLTAAVAVLATAIERTLVERIREVAEGQVDAVVARLAAGATPAEALEPTRASDLAAGGIPVQVEVLDEEGGHLVGRGFFTMPGLEGGVSTTGWPWADPVVAVGEIDLAMAQQAVRVDGELLLVVAASPLAEAIHSVSAVVRLSRLGVPVLVLLVGLGTWFATGRTLQPIERIRAEVQTLSSSSLERRVEVPATGDEVARLARTMNAMLARMESATTRQREFVSDAAHELRSPVTTIRTELEVALTHPDAGWMVAATEALRETDRIERLIEDLLLLARLDGPRPGSWSLVDVGELVRDGVPQVRGPDLDLDLADGLVVTGHASQLVSVVRNLLDNAARHATSRVHVTLAREPGLGRCAAVGNVVLTVDDDGPGIPAGDRLRVFERFTRLDTSRTRTDGGAGLGLAVVDRVVRQHGGTVVVGDSPTGGARFTVTLPQAAGLTSNPPQTSNAGP